MTVTGEPDPDASSYVVQVPATTANLGPGFDALGAAVSRWIVVGVDPPRRQRVVTDGEGAGEVSTGDDNLIWRSLVAFCGRYDVPVPNVSLSVRNDIPLERGLGSSSAAIVAGLVLGRALSQVPVGDLQLVDLATEIEGHPDNVAPAVLGGIVACTSTDEGELVLRRAQPAPASTLVVAVPPQRQNTEAARAALPEQLDRADVATQAARAVHVFGALTGMWPPVPAVTGDRLHEPARFVVMASSSELVRTLRGRGVHAWLSGAGPTVVAAVPRRDERRQDEILATVAEHGFVGRVADFDLSGALVCSGEGCAISGSGACANCPRRRL